MKNIAVFFGGTSVERDVSVITGVLTLNSIDRAVYNPVPVFIAGDGKFYTGESLLDIEFYKSVDYKKLKRVALLGGENILYVVKGKKIKPYLHIAVGVNCLHGERGEDGTLAGLMNTSNIPFASPPLLASAVSMDKEFTKIFLRGLGVKVLPCLSVKNTDANIEKAGLSYPVIVKPACLGSSIGITKAENGEELKDGIATALRYGERAIIEKCLENFTEINCSAYRGCNGKLYVSECERPFGKSEVLSFDDKYSVGERQFPAKIDKKIAEKIKKTTEKVYCALQCEGIIRIDYMLYGDTAYLNEINTVPGSLAYYLFSDTLKGFSKILTELIMTAEKKFARSSTFNKKYSSNILNLSGCKGGKGKNA